MMNDDQEIWPADFFDKTHSHTLTDTHMYAWILPWLGGYQLSTNDVWSGSGCLFTSYVEVIGRYMQAKAKNAGLTNNHAKNQNQNRKSPLPPI